MALFVDSLFPGSATDASLTPASSGSTPPTTVADSDSQHSDASKLDVITVTPDDAIYVASVDPQPPTPSQSPPSRRPRRSRASEPVYNLTKLAGAADRRKRRTRGDQDAGNRRRITVSGDILVGSIEVAGHAASAKPRDKALPPTVDALDLQWSPESLSTPRTRSRARASPRPQRTSSRLAGVSPVAANLTSIAKDRRKSASQRVTKLSRELRRLQDTNEFSGVDDQPVRLSVWSNGKFVDPNAPPSEPPRRKSMVKNLKEEKKEVAADRQQKDEEEEEKGKEREDDDDKNDEHDERKPHEEDKEPVINTKQRRAKKYLDKGLYAGQDIPLDVFKGLSPAEKKKLTTLPELKELNKVGRANKTMPFPIYTGLRMLIAGRDFKLPFNVCHPMPPGQPKPDEWKKMTRNRFIGDSKDYWRKAPHLHDLSKCVCKPEDGCGDNCQNRIMLYECDAGNCNVGKALCTNRSFADLASRRAKGGKYRIGVEVIKTSDRGYGVRSNRCFEPNQIIMEYTGEIITEEECERRMNEEYKNNECYYLMSFDQHMIIDATTGSIARFVNHSCNPNCRMIKWIVSGQPRMALFAGDRPIMTGEELTYDYNFDPFSAKNVQKCLCGEPNCRGVLGPKSRDVKPAKVDLNKTIKATVKAGKRKLKELMGGDEKDGVDGSKSKKKRKMAPAAGLKRSLSTAGAKAAKGAASAIKKSVSSISRKGNNKKKPAAVTVKSSVRSRISKAGAVKKTSTAVTKTTKLVKKGSGSATRPAQPPSRTSSMTIVAVTEDNTKPGKKGKTSPAVNKPVVCASTKASSQRGSLESPRRIIKPSPKAKANAAIRLVPKE